MNNKTTKLSPRLAVAIAAYFIGRDKQGMKVSSHSYGTGKETITFQKSSYVWDKEGAIKSIIKSCPKGWRFDSCSSGTFWFRRGENSIVKVDDDVWPNGNVERIKKKK